MKQLLSLNKYFIRYKWSFIVGIICTLVANFFSVISPQFVGFIVDKISNFDTKKHENSYNFLLKKVIVFLEQGQSSTTRFIIYASVILLLLAVLKGLFLFVMRQTIIVGSRDIEYDLKNDIYKKYQVLDINFYKKNFIGDLMNRISEDVGKVRMYVGPAIMYIINTIATIALSIYFMINTNGFLSLIVLAPLPFLAYIIYKLNFKIQQKNQRSQEFLSKLTTLATETFSGIRVVHSYNKEENIFNTFSKVSEQYQEQKIDLARLEAFYIPAMSLLINISTLLTIAVGGVMVIKNEIGVSVLIEFVMLINMLIFPVSALGWVANMIQTANASQKRINEFMAIDSVINKETPTNKKINIIPINNIQFKNVNFTYEHTQITAIKNFTLNINSGNKIAIMGKVGSGKSSIANLLVRNFDITGGQILINNIGINKWNLFELRNNISLVNQETFVFSDTLLNNIIMNNSTASEEDVIKVLKLVEFYTEVMNMPKQLNTLLGERGINLSGGQKQRLSIARALLKKSDLYIFDDSFSAIDQITEKKIIQNLTQYLVNKTQIFITHRMNTQYYFDKIIFLCDGEITEQGSFEELIKLKGNFYEVISM